MGESSILKGSLFILCAILTVVLFMPKNCPTSAIAPLVARKHEPPPAGLRINSAPPAAPHAIVTYPEGLDAEHLQYLIEINQQFAAPKMMSFDKASDDNALVKLGYVEKQGDTRTFSREGLLHVSGAIDQGTSWSVPVAKRAFVRVTKLDCGADTCSAEFLWQWQPNEIGTAARVITEPFPAVATLNASDHHWLLTTISGLEN